MAPPAVLPIIAIVGRPNVGKSTLFNRYAGRRRALVADEPGLTRDRIAEEVEVEGRRVLLVDTAGLEEADEGLPGAVQEQARRALDEADAVLFVVDGAAGLLPADSELGRMLRRTDKPVAVAVNKIDAPVHEPRTAEFHALGLEPLRGVSAEHGGGAWDLLETLVAALPKDDGAVPVESDDALRIAIVGRPNVGKSSLLNRMVGSERVVVSEVPGTTRDAIDVRVEDEAGAVVFVDTAGLRRPGKRRQEGAERGSALMTVRALERAQLALVVCDADEGFTEQDARVVSLARARGCTSLVLLNKWDLVEARAGRAAEVRSELDRRLRWLPDAPVIALSARSGKGTGRILGEARRLAEAANRKIPTPELNRWLQQATRRHEPAMAQRGSRKKPVKFFYATQVGTGPPAFALFCSDPAAVQESYRRFLTNRLRDDFALAGVPIRVYLRARRPEAG